MASCSARLAFWLLGFAASWLRGFLASRLLGFSACRLGGFLSSRPLGFLASWLPALLASWLVGFVALDSLLKPFCLITRINSFLSGIIIISTGSIIVSVSFDTGTTKIKTTQQTNKQLDAAITNRHPHTDAHTHIYIYISISLSLSLYLSIYLSS